MKKTTILKTLWVANLLMMLSACGGSSNESKDSSEESLSTQNESSSSDSEVRLKQVTSYNSNNKIAQKVVLDYNSENRLRNKYMYLEVDNKIDTGLYLYSESKIKYEGNKKIIFTGKTFNKNELLIGTSSTEVYLKENNRLDYTISESKQFDDNGLEISSYSFKFTALAWEENVARKTKIEETRIDASKTETKSTYYREEKQVDSYKMEWKKYDEKEKLLSETLTCTYDSKGIIDPWQYTDSPLYKDFTLTGTVMIGCGSASLPMDFITTIEETNTDGLVTKKKKTYKGKLVLSSVYEYIN